MVNKLLITILLLIFCPILVFAQAIDDKGQTFEARSSNAEQSEGEEKTVFSKTEPVITLSKWGGEAAPKIKYDGIAATGQDSNGTIKWKSATQELHSYPLNNGEDGVEIEVLLKQHPDSNIFTFTLSDYENLDFFYQAPLNQEDHSGESEISSCTPTECVGPSGTVVVSRPEKIVGSYAVYHKTKKDYRVGGINYKTGKAFHIYRPEAIDSNGHRVWADLKIDDGKLSVIVPQDFIDNAVYPVIVDPTFGKTAIGGTANNTQVDYIEASHYTLSDSNAVVSKLTAYVANPGASGHNFKGVIYNQSSSKPLTKQASSSGVAISAGAAAAWVDYTLSVTLNSGEYWLGLDCDNVDTTFYYDAGAANSAYWFTVAGTYATPPTTWTDFSNSRTRLQSNYATYTIASTGVASVINNSILDNIVFK